MMMMKTAMLKMMKISINTEVQSGSLRILLSHCPSDITALLLPSLFTAVAMNCLGILDLAVRRDNPCPDGLSGSWCASNKFTERVPSTCPQKRRGGEIAGILCQWATSSEEVQKTNVLCHAGF